MALHEQAAVNLQPDIPLVLRRHWAVGLLLWLAANALILLPGAPGLSWGVVTGLLLLGVVLPGLLLAVAIFGRAQTTPFEFVVYAGGLGFVGYCLALLVVAVIPGPLWGWQVVVALNVLVVLAALGVWFVTRSPAPVVGVAQDMAPPADATPSRMALLGLASVVLVAALLRLPNLGYSDFQGDEARAMLRASEVIQGYPSALVIHKKGPLEILVPTGLYAVQQRINEAQARLPFALAGLLGIAVVYLLGWRMFGAVAGWVAAMLLAVDGYLVGFARIVQYQSFVFLMSALVVLALYRQATSTRPRPAFLLAAGLFFVGGLYAHYEALWVVIPGLYLLWVYGRRTGDWRGLWRALWGPALLVVGLLAAFYIPFLLDARWGQTARDVFGNRIGSSFPYNNLVDFFERTTLYSSTYQVILMIVGTLGAQAVVLLRIWPRGLAWTVVGLTTLGIGITVWGQTDWLRIGGTDHTWLFFALVIATVTVPRRVPAETRTVWLWFGVPMVLSIFFVDKPNSHVYGFFTGWALVNGLFWEAVWGRVAQIGATWRPIVRFGAVTAAALVTAVLALYTFQLFTYTQVEVLRTWAQNRPSGYWTPYTLPTRGSLFGFPYKNGWKVVGALYADGTLDAPFTSNESNRVGEWYGRGAYFCPPDAEFYMLPTTLQPDEALEDPLRLAELAHNGFAEWGVVTVDGDPRLRIFTTRPVSGAPRVFEESAYASGFDRGLTSPWFVKPGPAIVNAPAAPVAYRLNEHVWLKGYTLAQPQVTAGSRVALDLYWQMAAAQDIEDKVFVQIIDPVTLRKVAQRDAEPGCTKYSMDEWRAGELNYDPYQLTIAADAPPGVYTVLVGMYDAESHDRYAVFDAQGGTLGDAIILTTIEVVAP